MLLRGEPTHRALAARTLALGLVLCAAACAKDLDALAPFPCALDGTCPGSLVCDPARGCVVPELGSPCQEGLTDCRRAHPDATCTLGVCALPCSDGAPCADPLSTCSASGAQGSGVCLRRCDEAAGGAAACAGGVTCRTASGRAACSREDVPLDRPCASDADCLGAGSNVRCQLGVCGVPCDGDRPCAGGYACSAKPGGGGLCVRDCSAGQLCGEGLACADLWHLRKRGCVGPATMFPACAEARTAFACPGVDSVCGTRLDHGERCSDGSFCPKGSRCDGAGGCFTECAAGSEARLCGGGPCSGAACVSDGWWCAPTDLALTCDQDPSRVASACECSDGRILVSGCGAGRSCEALCRDACDPVAQDCANPATPKCSLVDDGDGANHRCIPEDGTRGPGERCDRASSGRDDCARGLFCTAALDGAGEDRCARFCARDAGCQGAGEVCWSLSPTDDTRLCARRCTPFGDDCPAGTACKMDVDTGSGACVRPVEGAAAVDGLCVGFEHLACAGDLLCAVTGRCRAPCDADHPCERGRCSGEDTPHGRGVCLPGS